jgi:hypothetical protein
MMSWNVPLLMFIIIACLRIILVSNISKYQVLGENIFSLFNLYEVKMFIYGGLQIKTMIDTISWKVYYDIWYYFLFGNKYIKD